MEVHHYGPCLFFYFSGLKLRLFGGASVKWQDKKGQNQPNALWHKEEEVYFDDTFVLWGQGKY